jgi:glycosyltransferase involved in cell wall biosynthesis
MTIAEEALSDIDVSIVIPLRDEELNVEPLHAELTAAMAPLGLRYEMIVIDDGSIDGTFARLAAIQGRDPHVSVIRFKRNFGQTAAFAAGFDQARGRFIVTSDGDLQNDPADIPRMLTLARQFDIVCGWRKDRKDTFLTRHVPSVIANRLLAWNSGIPIHDNGCSLKVFRADVIKPLRLRPGMHRYLPALASQLGNRVTEVVVRHRPRRFGHSKYGLSRTFGVIADLVHLRRLMREAIDPATPVEGLYEIAEIRRSESRALRP